MSRPRLLDLFCGAGGCSVGYDRAGFDVVGVDIEEHPDYPFEFYRLDAMALRPDVLNGCWHESSSRTSLQGMDLRCLGKFDVVAASPPCPRYSTVTPDASRDKHPDLIPDVRATLKAWGGVYIIENVAGAARVMDNPIKICGSAFGLGVRRHRFFESNAWLTPTECFHEAQGEPLGVYGKHADPVTYRRPGLGTSRGVRARSVEEAQQALGIDWMSTWDDLTDAIPPAYTSYLGGQLIDLLRGNDVGQVSAGETVKR